MAMMALGCFIGNAQAIDTKAIYFDSQGVEVMVNFQSESTQSEVHRVVFSAVCGQNYTRCASDSFQANMMDDFVTALKYGRFYKYVYVPFDPCMEPGADCIPHVIEPFTEQSAVSENVLRSGYRLQRQTTNTPTKGEIFINSMMTEAGSTVVGTIADYIKGKSETKNNSLSMYMVFTSLIDGKRIPLAVCKVAKYGCDFQPDVSFKELMEGKIHVSIPIGDGSGMGGNNPEYRSRERSIEDTLNALEYKCRPTLKGSDNWMVKNLTCYRNK
ncbi:hypothetical protein N473_00165 [Pseudoalteromonas luteoviolacea CPMOR-1]|uniref:Uncharacterized protein n=2 Tax=Pseudoalteromonas luteoviolacea TaxID=43657 RepID=A0A167NQI2_9GAMM|nr:hypothetical protein N473_00165 [Pseudoalteromonas luteoviolacea CPMOR-1]